jgi:phosphatidate cytidylyltransferase
MIAVSAYLFEVLFFVWSMFDRSTAYLAVVLFVVLSLVLFVLRHPKIAPRTLECAVFAFVYVAVALSFIYTIRMDTNGSYYVWLIFISAWGCDTCAYVTGMTIGKHKITPMLSPKKSLEGYIGGIVGAAIIGAGYAAVLNVVHDARIADGASAWPPSAHPAIFAVICAMAAIVSTFGDLAASGIKRAYKIKDYGKLIPGHGGILDRFDSAIFGAPVVYMLLLAWSKMWF